jgi:hypothetical protein
VERQELFLQLLSHGQLQLQQQTQQLLVAQHQYFVQAMAQLLGAQEHQQQQIQLLRFLVHQHAQHQTESSALLSVTLLEQHLQVEQFLQCAVSQ